MMPIVQVSPDWEIGPDMSAPEFHALQGPSKRPWGHAMFDEIHNKMGIKGQGSAIAVIDDGCELNHENFTDSNGDSRIIYHESFVPGERSDTGGTHGTHVAGTAGGRFTGVAPESKLIILKGLNRNGSGSSQDLAKCYGRLAEMQQDGKIDCPIVVSNGSFGGPSFYAPQENALEDCESALISNVVAAGNAGGSENRPTCGHPAKSQFAVAVGALNSNWELSDYSSRCGDRLMIAAPGTNVISSTVGGRYGSMSGTSMASPYVAGMQALINCWLIESGQSVLNTQSEWNEFYKRNATDLGKPGKDSGTGHGYVDFLELGDWLAKGKLKWV